jgi:hypothetical protein
MFGHQPRSSGMMKYAPIHANPKQKPTNGRHAYLGHELLPAFSSHVESLHHISVMAPGLGRLDGVPYWLPVRTNM